MTDILTTEERRVFEKVKVRLSDVGEFIRADSDLIALVTVIDNVSKRGTEKCSEKEMVFGGDSDYAGPFLEEK